MNALTKNLIVILLSLGVTTVSAIDVGQVAPDFTLTDQHNEKQTLSKMKGKWIVLYFYPKDETPGCTAEACSFRDNISAIRAKNTVVWGLSVDNNESHEAFAKHHKLPFTLLADPKGKVAQQYDSLLNLFVMKLAKRHSFIIDPKGNIAKAYMTVNPKGHVADILKDLKTLQE